MIVKKRPLITLATKLGDIPVEWLRYVEPRLVRTGQCWLWEGACDGEGEPVLSYRNLETGKRNTRRLKQIIANIFWEMKSHYEVIHQCGNINCLNPAHFYISWTHHSQEDRQELIAAKRRNLNDYEHRK